MFTLNKETKPLILTDIPAKDEAVYSLALRPEDIKGLTINSNIVTLFYYNHLERKVLEQGLGEYDTIEEAKKAYYKTLNIINGVTNITEVTSFGE
jgi:hypothetical protein